MPGEEPTTSQWLEQNRSHFEQTGQFASRIDEQNQIYSDLIEGGQLTVKPFQELATDYLTTEQEHAFNELVKAEKQTPFRELSERTRALEKALGAATTKLSDIEQQQKEKIDLILREKQFLSEVLPGLVPKLTELTVQLEHRLLDEARQEAEAEVIALQGEYEGLEEMIDISGRSWPIPRLASTKRLEKVKTDRLIEVDDFPDSPIRLTKQEITERVLKDYPEDVLRDASELLALLLAEEPKHIFTLEDLGLIIYGDDEPNRRMRVSALISNFELGKVGIIGKLLNEEGLVFQRGERRSYRSTDGKQIGRNNPVFRAVPLSELERKERVVHCDEKVEWVNDGWHTVVFESTHEDLDNSDKLDVACELNDDEAPEIAEEPEVKVTLLSTSDDAIAVAGDVIVLEPKVQPVKSPLPVPAREEVTKIKEPEWKINFRESVIEAITQFASDGLMIDGEISWSVVGAKSSSRIMGTKTMAERAVSNGIISRLESQVDCSLHISKFICMALQNKYQELFTDKNRRKQAIAIVKHAIKTYFEEAKKIDNPLRLT